MAITETVITDTFDVWRENTNETATKVGDLTILDTSNKDDLVEAINELGSNSSDIADDVATNTTDISNNSADISINSSEIGTIGDLDTSSTNLVEAINEVKEDMEEMLDPIIAAIALS